MEPVAPTPPGPLTPALSPGGGEGEKAAGDTDYFRFEAKQGRGWVIETMAARRGSPADTKIEVLHADGRPVERVWLQAVRDSSVTFRGIDSNNPDCRLVNWEEMELNQFVYLGGEVLRLFRAYSWPGNVRQLFNVLRTASVMAADEPQITREHLSDDFLDEARAAQASRTSISAGLAPAISSPVAASPGRQRLGEPINTALAATASLPAASWPATPPTGPAWSVEPAAPQRSLEEIGIAAIRHAVAAAGGNISEASKRLGISRNTIYRKLRWNKPG